MRLAYFSPLNPQPSGISDYSEELLPYLATEAEITLFVEGFEPSNREIRERFEWLDYCSDPAVLQTLGNYDAVLYHMGNDHRYHAGISEVMRTHPGIVVFHDFALQDFFLGLARERGEMNLFLDEVKNCHGNEQWKTAGEFLRRGSVPPQMAMPLEFPLNCSLARAAEGIIVHSEWSRERFQAITPATPVTRINHHITAAAALAVQKPAAGTTTRIASFGLITQDKGIERALSALATLQKECQFHYTLVGPDGNFPELRELVRRYQLQDQVSITGHVSLPDFERLISETDIAINLRERPVGATSGSLCRIMAAGVPAVVSNVGAFAELPDDAVVKVDPGGHADALLQAYLRTLIDDEKLREAIGQNARNYVLANHDIGASATKYMAFIRKVIAGRPRKVLLDNIAQELTLLRIPANDETVMRAIAAEVAVLAPADSHSSEHATPSSPTPMQAGIAPSGNGHFRSPYEAPDLQGRTPKVADIDYKQSAIDYLGELSEERQHHLRTKPFYNLANKPTKYKGEGMDADMHRHFCDFANIAVGLALPSGSRILDVGCGSGWLSEYFARLGYQVKGIDISPALITMSRERVARVPYGVDHETPLRCTFEVHDIELAPLAEKFEAIICYDSLHHLEDERSVFRHLAQMLDVGGLLFILEGQKPSVGSATEDELRGVMREFGTLESPFSTAYLRELISANGFIIVGDYVSVNGLFEREMLEGNGANPMLPLRTLPTDYHYLTCMKVTAGAPATSVPDSRQPGVLRAEFTLNGSQPHHIEAGDKFELALTVKNAGDTLWLNGQTVRSGVVMPGVRIIDARGEIITELHGHPMLPRAVPPGLTVDVRIQLAAPAQPGRYTVKIDLVDQHVCWFEERGSQPLVFSFEVEG
jgi:2-polyprenyl-3-methyl-5-hydroxy-6-metoxy-1,4-benzoquinol methylase/glycosyltransferase involved in cell wall biosynthesis